MVDARLTDRTLIHEGTLDELVQLGMSTDGGLLNDNEKERRASRSSSHHREDFTQTRTWDEAVDLARNGWAEGVKRLSDLRDSLLDEVGMLMPEPIPIMDVAGEVVDVGAYVTGQPEHMVTWFDDDGRTRHIHVVVNVTANAGKSAESMMMRGLLAAGLVDSLEHAGHRVELDVISVHAHSRQYAAVAHIKKANEVLDLERTVFACAHPAMLRRIVFSTMEAAPTSKVRESIGTFGGYGHPLDSWKIPFPDRKPDIYIGNAEEAEDMNQVRDKVIGYLREAGALRD